MDQTNGSKKKQVKCDSIGGWHCPLDCEHKVPHTPTTGILHKCTDKHMCQHVDDATYCECKCVSTAPFKMYILIKNTVPIRDVGAMIAKASLGYSLYTKNQEILKKTSEFIICSVSEKQLEKAQKFTSFMTPGNFTVVFCPRQEYPTFFERLKRLDENTQIRHHDAIGPDK